MHSGLEYDSGLVYAFRSGVYTVVITYNTTSGIFGGKHFNESSQKNPTRFFSLSSTDSKANSQSKHLNTSSNPSGNTRLIHQFHLMTIPCISTKSTNVQCTFHTPLKRILNPLKSVLHCDVSQFVWALRCSDQYLH